MNSNKYFFIILTLVCKTAFGQFENSRIIKSEISANDNSVAQFLEWTASEEFLSFKTNLIKEYETSKWDDWYLYKISQSLFEYSFPEKGENEKALSCWYILNQVGLDVRIVFSGKLILLFVRPKEGIFGAPERIINGTKYVSLSANIPRLENPSDSKFNVNEKGERFSFEIRNYPKIFNDLISYEIGFYDSVFHHKSIVFNLKYDYKQREFLRDYPNLEYGKLFNTPLSEVVYNSLIPQLNEVLANIDSVDRIEFLFNFVKDAFIPQSDIEVYGKDKWLTPEESLGTYDDSEDKAGLLYFLIKELINVPIICFYCSETDNVIVGVSLNNKGGNGTFVYKDLNFKFLDPYYSQSFYENIDVSHSCTLVVEYFPDKLKR